MKSLDWSWASFLLSSSPYPKPWERVSLPGYYYIGGYQVFSWSAMLPFTCLCLKLLFETRFKHNVHTEIFLRNLCSSVLPFLWLGSTFFLVREFKTSLFPIIEPLYNPRILNSLSLGPILVDFMRGPEIIIHYPLPSLSRQVLDTFLTVVFQHEGVYERNFSRKQSNTYISNRL